MSAAASERATSSKVRRLLGEARARRCGDRIQGEAEAAVLAVGEKYDGFAAGASGKKFMRGKKNGLINIGAAGVAKKFADVDARDGLADQSPIIRKREQEIGVRGKIDDGDLIGGREAVHERASGGFHFVTLRQDAGAGVDNQSDGGGLRGGVEISDGLLDAVIEDAKVLARQASESGAAGVGYADR